MKRSTALLNRILSAAVVLCALALVVVGSIALFNEKPGHSPADAAPADTGSLQIQAVDGASDVPLAGVTIVIPETSQTYTTGDDGKTQLIRVPIIKDTHYQDLLAMPWGEITILAFKDGYIPYALFYVQVWENEVRQGPNLLMFREGSTSTSQPFSIVEGPQRLWVEQILEKYKP
ncbi:MAG: hypothetical protein ACOYI4_02690 [Christensenellales bacterium]|jgi:hypothetical protein